MAIGQVSKLKRFLLVLWVWMGCSVAEAQPLDDVGLEFREQGVVATIRLTGPVQYQRHFPESDGKTLEIFYDEPFLWNLSAEHKFSLSNSDSGITIPGVEGCAAHYSLYIQTDGSVRPCMFCPPELTYGNAAMERLGDIWNRMTQDRVLTGWAQQNSREGKCASCTRFESCRGCLARTTILLKNPLASDPCCPFAS